MADPRVTRHHPTRAETRGFADVYALVLGILLTVIGLRGFFADAHFDATHQESFIGLFEVNGWANLIHLIAGILGLVAWKVAPAPTPPCSGCSGSRSRQLVPPRPGRPRHRGRRPRPLRPAGAAARRPCRRHGARLLGLNPLLGQLTLEDLARRRARQLVDEVDVARHLVAGEVGLHVVLELLLADLLALALDHDRLQALAELLVVDAEHGHVGDGLVAGEQVLDLGGEDVLPA